MIELEERTLTPGQWLKMQRNSRGLSQAQVAAKIGANDPSAISRIENAKPGAKPPEPHLLRGYAQLFDTTVRHLLDLYGYGIETEGADSTDPDQEFWAAYGDLLTEDEWETLEQIADQFMRSRGVKP